MNSAGGGAGAGLAAFREFRPDFELACGFAWEDGVSDDAFWLKGTWVDGCDGSIEICGEEREGESGLAEPRACPGVLAEAFSGSETLRVFCASTRVRCCTWNSP